MPRDSSGVYTLPLGNPVISNDIIQTAWANPTMSDIAVTLQDSLSRSGKGGMLVPFKFTDGAIAAPGISWQNEPTSGLYRAGTNDFRFSCFGTDVFLISATGVGLPAGKTFSGGSFTGTTLTGPTITGGTLAGGAITGGTIDNTVIGGTTPAAGTFTRLIGTSSVGNNYPGNAGANSWWIDNNGGASNMIRLRALGQDASTLGSFQFQLSKSDNTGTITPLAVTSAGVTVTGTLTASGAGSAAGSTINAGVGGDGLQHSIKIFGTSALNKAPVLSLFRSGANEYFIAGGSTVGPELGFGVTTGLADYNDATLAAAAQVAVTGSGLKVRSGGIDFNAQSAPIVVGNCASAIYEASTQHIFRNIGGGTEYARFDANGASFVGYLGIGPADSSNARWLFYNKQVPGNTALRITGPDSSNSVLSMDVVLGNSSAAEKTFQIQANGGLTQFGGPVQANGGTSLLNASLAVKNSTYLTLLDTAAGASQCGFLAVDGVNSMLIGSGGATRVTMTAAGAFTFGGTQYTFSFSGTPALGLTLSGSNAGVSSGGGQHLALGANGVSGYWAVSGIAGTGGGGAIVGDFLPLGGDNLYSVGASGDRVKNIYAGGDVSAGAHFLLTGTAGGAGGATRYIGAGGGSHFYYNVATGNSHIFGVNETQVEAISSAGVAITGNLTVTGTVSGGSFNTNFAPAATSPETTIVQNTDISWAHGLGRLPYIVRAALRCKTAELGYAVGDEIDLRTSDNPGNTSINASAIRVNATNVFFRCMDIALINTGWGLTLITKANWKLVFYVW